MNQISVFCSDNSGSEVLQLKAESEMLATCGDNVTLTCNATSSEDLGIFLFSWLYRNETVCHHKSDRSDAKVRCESPAGTKNQRSLSLTLFNVSAEVSGRYLCKLQSKLGAKYTKALLRIQGWFIG